MNETCHHNNMKLPRIESYEDLRMLIESTLFTVEDDLSVIMLDKVGPTPDY